MRLSHLGRKLSEETKRKMSLSHKGKKKPWVKGFKGVHTEESRLKMSLAKIGVKQSEQHRINQGLGHRGEKHGLWKGDEVSYRNLHKWVERMFGKPSKCSACGKVGYGRQIHWANISHKYLRDITDWVRLCVKCHKQYDKKT